MAGFFKNHFTLPDPHLKNLEKLRRDPEQRAIISVTLQLPVKLVLAQEQTWKIRKRDKFSCIGNLLNHLSNNPKSTWKHIHVAWPGVIGAGLQPDHIQELKLTQASMGELRKFWGEHKLGVPVWLGAKQNMITYDRVLQDQWRWSKYGDEILYPLFHHELDALPSGTVEELWWCNYQRMNGSFAKCIAQFYQHGDIIWIHDHHLLLLPHLLRRMFPDIIIGLQLDIPFPSAELLRALSNGKALLEGMMSSDMIAFQDERCRGHFEAFFSRILSPDEQVRYAKCQTKLTVLGPCVYSCIASCEEFAKFEASVPSRPDFFRKSSPHDQQVIISIDRLDHIKDMTRKIQSFEKFLDAYPEWGGKVILTQIVAVIPGDYAPGQSNLTEIIEIMHRVNLCHGSIDFQPVRVVCEQLKPDEVLELLHRADLGLMTSARGSISRYAIDYVICQHRKHSPIIVSELSGTGRWLEGSLRVNPYNLTEVACEIKYALRMAEDERAWRHGKAINKVIETAQSDYSSKFIEHVLSASQRRDKAYPLGPMIALDGVRARYKRSTQRMFFFDYDGTLAPIVEDPVEAMPSLACLELLGRLLEDVRNHVWIISGRDQAFLQCCFGGLARLGLFAEHGCFIRHPVSAGSAASVVPYWENVLKGADMSWQDALLPLVNEVVMGTSGSFVERKQSAVAWHYRGVTPTKGEALANELMSRLVADFETKYEVECYRGKCTIEVRPRAVNKGEAVKRVLRDYWLSPARNGRYLGFVFCAGDDTTDEDMFSALDDSMVPNSSICTCAIGPPDRKTRAYSRFNDPVAFVEFLLRVFPRHDF